MSQAYGGLWYLDDSIVMDKIKHQDCLINLQTEFARTGENFAKDFRTRYPNDSTNDLSSWLAAISYLRNVIAHHSQIFGRDILKRPILPRNPRNQWLQFDVTPVQERKPFVVISTMIYLCNLGIFFLLVCKTYGLYF